MWREVRVVVCVVAGLDRVPTRVTVRACVRVTVRVCVICLGTVVVTGGAPCRAWSYCWSVSSVCVGSGAHRGVGRMLHRGVGRMLLHAAWAA